MKRSRFSSIFPCSLLFPLSSKPDTAVLAFQSLSLSVYSACHQIFVAYHQPCPAFYNCSLLTLPPTLCFHHLHKFSVKYRFKPFSSIDQAKALTYLYIPDFTSSLSLSSQARTSSHFSFTASFGFVIFNTVKLRTFKSLQIYFTSSFTKLQTLILSHLLSFLVQWNLIPACWHFWDRMGQHQNSPHIRTENSTPPAGPKIISVAFNSTTWLSPSQPQLVKFLLGHQTNSRCTKIYLIFSFILFSTKELVCSLLTLLTEGNLTRGSTRTKE